MDRYDRLIAEARERPFAGWDLTFDGRIATTAPWDFDGDVAALARDAPRMLDMGTGGGEWLSRLPHRAAHTVATEAWTPNVGVAARHLRPLGIAVVHVDDTGDNTAQHGDDARLPFRDASFPLVVNRHESFVASDVARILAPGGRFVTQQVADGFNHGYYALLGLAAPTLPPRAWQRAFAQAQLAAAGLVVDAGDDGDERVAFSDVGALAWYLKNLPWVMPGFDVGAADPALRRVHAQIERDGAVVVRQALFRLSARRVPR